MKLKRGRKDSDRGPRGLSGSSLLKRMEGPD